MSPNSTEEYLTGTLPAAMSTAAACANNGGCPLGHTLTIKMGSPGAFLLKWLLGAYTSKCYTVRQANVPVSSPHCALLHI